MKIENINKLIIKNISIIVLVLLITFGISYAFFQTNVKNVESSNTISVGGATFKIEYTGTETIEANNITPGWVGKKYFTIDITNPKEETINYDINLVVTSSNFQTYRSTLTNDGIKYSYPYLEYALYECTSASDKECTTKLSSYDSIISTQSGTINVESLTSTKTETKYYALAIIYPKLEDVIQYQTAQDGNLPTFTGYVRINSTERFYEDTFATDSWETIANNIKNGKSDIYMVGSEKEIEIDGTSYTVRVANNTSPDECNNADFSETACGFVVEFVDIVETRQMNSTSTNVGGWPASSMRTYANGDFFNKLPNDLQNVIIDTKVISGYGSTSGETNFTSTDKIYLLSAKEVYIDGTSNAISSYDSAYNNTRQLDYYVSKGVTTSSYTNAIKQNNGSNAIWWLRSASSYYSYSFLIVISNGYWSNTTASVSSGFAPAFRIGQETTINETLINKISNLDKTSNGLEVDDTDDQNLRYVGSTPNNYISFNNETWRIIGLFNVYNTDTNTTEKLVKIIKNDSLGDYSWYSSASGVNSGYGINEWSQAHLMTELNTDYIDTGKTTGTTLWYNGNYNAKNGTYDYSNNIKSTYINKIANVRWNLGASSSASNKAQSFYTSERGTTHVSSTSDGITRTNYWDGKIALMYPSDYGYASTNTTCRSSLSSTNCQNNNWLYNGVYQWTLSPSSSSAYHVYSIPTNGGISTNGGSKSIGVRPTLYLKSSTMITGGTGTSADPYTIE